MKSPSEIPRIALCLYGNFNNRLDPNSGSNGFKYIKAKFLDEYSPDVFVFSSDLENEEQILRLYGPWIVAGKFTDAGDFDEIASKNGIDTSMFTPIEPFRTVGNSLSFLFNRGASIALMKRHCEEIGQEYDWVVVARFDLGQLDRINGKHSHRVSEIGFHPKLSSTYFYSAQWQQHNLGLADQWFFSSQTNIEKLGEMCDWALSALRPMSRYLTSIADGIPDSRDLRPFSNEILEHGPKAKALSKISKSAAVNNHLLHKFFFLESEGLYPKLRFTSDFGPAANIVYTHSDYKDVWPAFFGQLERHLGPFGSNYVFVDRVSEGIPEYFDQIVYDDTKSYTDRVSHCLAQVPEEVVLFQHEDMILYSTPRAADLSALAQELIRTSPKFDCAKLVSGGIFLHLPIVRHRGFMKIWSKSPWIFSIQPSLWKKSSLEELLKLHPDQTIWEFESRAQNTVRKLGLRTISPKKSRKKRGRHHWDNPIYPVVSTAISKGKWVFSEYEEELAPILSAYGIDPSIRGTDLSSPELAS